VMAAEADWTLGDVCSDQWLSLECSGATLCYILSLAPTGDSNLSVNQASSRLLLSFSKPPFKPP